MEDRLTLARGTKLGAYEVLKPIGAGGMGEVYKANDTRIDRVVAIKVLPSNLAGDAGLEQRFEPEAKSIASLDHPHICTLYEFDRHEGIDFLVMEPRWRVARTRWSRDGERFLMVERRGRGTDVRIMLTWIQELEARVPSVR